MSQLIDLGKLRFYFAGDYNPATEYESNDIVKYGGNVYVYTNTTKATGVTPTSTSHWALMVEGFKFRGVFSPGTAYKVGDGIAHGGKVYIAVLDSTGQTPPNVTYWSQFADGIQYEGTYVAGTTYQKNDVVKYGAQVYIALQDTTGNLPTNTTFWTKFVDGISPQSVYNAGTAYVPGDVVAYGANLYRATANTTNNVPTNTSFWELFVESVAFKGNWATATLYGLNSLVKYGASSYICTIPHTSGTFATDIGAGRWVVFNQGLRNRGTWTTGTSYLVDDLATDGSSTYICIADHVAGSTLAADISGSKWTLFAVAGALPNVGATDHGKSLTVNVDGTTRSWIGATTSNKVFYVAPHGLDAVTSGRSMATPYASVKYATTQCGTDATIFVKTGTYSEQLPITVPNNVAIVGDNQRTTIIQPATGLSDDGVTPNNQSTMFLMSNGAILNKMTFTGMTGWVPGSTPADVTTSTIRGVYTRLNPNSPVTTKSPYVLECSAIGTGGIGALIDGSVHATGAKTMIFHGYTIISDNGIGYWVKDGGKAEIVSCFTYYCYFGYTASGGGFIRALNGNNSYGTWGCTSRGFDASETPLTGTVFGQELNFVYTGGNINVGDTVTGPTGTATVTNAQLSGSSNKVYVTGATGTFTLGQALTFTSGGTGTVSAGALRTQRGFIIVGTGFTSTPLPGQSITLSDDSISYVVQSVSGTYVNSSSRMVLVLAQEKPTGSANGAGITLRSKFSQIRLTGHDFLDIGTGGTVTTNYPGTPTQPAAQGNEVDEAFPGRVYYVSTDQNGNFRVGEYFRIDQATGTATLNANAFNLAGLTSLRLGSIGAQLGETINEFSSDGTMSGNSNTAVPTEQATKTYVDTGLATKQNTLVSATNIRTVNGSSLVGSGNVAVGDVTLAGVQTLTNKTFSNTLMVGDNKEFVTVTATAATGTIPYDVLTQQVLFYTSNASGNFTLNIRGNSTTTLNSLLSNGQSITVVFMNTCGSSAFFTSGLQVDGSSVTVRWQGGTTPSSGNTNSIDIYSFNIVKTANATYTVLGSQTRFA